MSDYDAGVMLAEWDAMMAEKEAARLNSLAADERFRARFDRVARWAACIALFVLGFVLGLAGSAHAQTPRIHDAERYYPDYRAAYAEAVECTGVKHPPAYGKIVWLKVPRASFRDVLAPAEEGKLPNIGEWVFPDSIFIAAAYADSWVPKHEMIHYLRRNGEHPREVFGDACHATWGYLPPDSSISGPGTTVRGPAFGDR